MSHKGKVTLDTYVSIMVNSYIRLCYIASVYVLWLRSGWLMEYSICISYHVFGIN